MVQCRETPDRSEFLERDSPWCRRLCYFTRTFFWQLCRARRELQMAFEKLSLEGKVAVVIGGTTGIGREIALGLADAGADVVASSRREEQVASMARLIEARGRRTLTKACDVAHRESL